MFDCVFSRQAHAGGAERWSRTDVHHADRGDGSFRVNDEVVVGARRASVRRAPLGSVHDGCPRGVEDDRDGQLAFTDPGSIYLDGKNVLGLVVEINSELLGVPSWSGSSPRR